LSQNIKLSWWSRG